jgi:hypothetical protein
MSHDPVFVTPYANTQGAKTGHDIVKDPHANP